MLLSDRTIRSRLQDASSWESWQRLTVSPLRHDAIQPCSLDVHLAGPLKVYTGPVTDTRRDNSPWWETLCPEEGTPLRWVLQPSRLYLAVVDEWLVIPEDCCGQINGISSRARDGIVVHQQAGLLDSGWEGRATLELTVTNPHTILYNGQRIAQVTFTLLDQRCERPYRGRYQGDLGATPALPDHEGMMA